MKASVILYRALPSPASPNFSIWAFDAMPQPNFPNPVPKSALSAKTRSVSPTSQIAHMAGRSLTLHRPQTYPRNRTHAAYAQPAAARLDLGHRRYWLNPTLPFAGPRAATLADHRAEPQSPSDGSLLAATAHRGRRPPPGHCQCHCSVPRAKRCKRPAAMSPRWQPLLDCSAPDPRR
jgi:hypothetical protein